jgi:prepilin-type N-terminal cleavage/methylation domain-containing protein
VEAHASTLVPRHPYRTGRPEGATLIELLIVLTILAILFAAAAPNVGRMIAGHRATSATNDLIHGIALARSEALRRGRRVYLAPSGARWRDGWVVFIDRNDNRQYDGPASGVADELIARHVALADSTQIANTSGSTTEPFTDTGSPPRVYILFDGHGYPRKRNGALNIGGVVVTDTSGRTSSVRTVCLASSGRVRVVVDRAVCS